MSKPWFLAMTTHAEPSLLAGVIANVLRSSPSMDPVDVQSVNSPIGIPSGIKLGKL